MKNVSLKNCVPYIAAIGIFLAISILYFTPEIFQSKTLYQHDVVTGNSVSRETQDFNERTGENTYWTNSMFGGMPTYQISPSYSSLRILSKVQKISFLYLPAPASYVFMLLIGAFLLFLALRVNPWLAILGAIAYAFSSYFFIIIQAGHIWKVWVLAYIPATFAGIIWAYRGKYWLGAIVTTIYMALQLLSNHPQMTYYFGLVVLFFVIGEFITCFKSKQLPRFFKASAVVLVSVAIAFALNLSSMYHTFDYSKYSIRGGSELSNNTGDQTDGGLERSYITSWSYGIGETFTLLIPNAKGGASGILGQDKSNVDKAIAIVQNDSRIPNQVKNAAIEQILYSNSYWGDQTFTSGPVYVGAFILFLFILGIFIVRTWFKWVLVAATVLSIFLAWGSNFMGFTDFFLNYIPYYNKLRAVASVLVIAELCIPILAILTLKEIIDNPSVIKEKKTQFIITLACTAGLILLFIIAPKLFFNFLSTQESANFANIIKSNPQNAVIYGQISDVIQDLRVLIFRADALRSLLIICLGVTLLLLFSMKKINFKLFVIAVLALVIFDMWQVDKRYLNGGHFQPKRPQLKLIPMTPVDEEILRDTTLDYRVMNLTVSTFNDGTTSFYHKSVGGYHGAKMRRYQDIIEHYLAGITAQNAASLVNTKYFDVLNMLNTRYIILPGQGNSQQLLRNPNALGNAWFVNEIKWVDNADEEIAALGEINPAKVAVIDRRFENNELKSFKPNTQQTLIESIDGDESTHSGNDAYFVDSSKIEMLSYEPNKLIYQSDAIAPKLAVFSEVYYPKDWHAYIDGVEVPFFRVNYILRAMLVPEGKHTIEFRFDPQSIYITERIAWFNYIILLGIVIGAIVWGFLPRKKKGDDSLIENNVD